MPQSRQYKTFWILLLVLACGCYGLHDWQQVIVQHPNRLIRDDPNDILVVGMKSAPHFTDTLIWWHGPWIAGATNHYYRPITSLAFWLEYKAFGINGLIGFSVVHGLSHLAVLLLLYFFVRELGGERLATVTACLYALQATALLSLPDIWSALYEWVNDEDIWMAGFYVVSLWCLLRYLRGAGWRWLWYSLLAFAGSIFCKEMAYTLPMLVPVLLWHEKKANEWKPAAAHFATAVVLFCLRYAFIGGIGTRDGTNGSWYIRGLTNEFGITMRTIGGDLLPLGLALLGLAIAAACIRKTRRAIILAGLAVVCVCVTPLLYHEPLQDTFLRLLGSELPWIFGLWTGLFVFFVWRFLVRRDRTQVFGYAWAFISYIPMMMAVVWMHGWYLPAMGWSLWLACAVLDGWEMGLEAWGPRLPPSLRQRLHTTTS